MCACIGILCGNCKDGKGVSVLFNKCVDCNNAFGALIAALSRLRLAIILMHVFISTFQSLSMPS